MKAASVEPLPHAACPLCGGPNGCAVARHGRFDVACWCATAAIDPGSLALVPEAQRHRACLCPRCAQAPADADGRAFEAGAAGPAGAAPCE